MSDKEAPPSDMVAVFDDYTKTFILYYVNKFGFIHYTVGPNPGLRESDDDAKWDDVRAVGLRDNNNNIQLPEVSTDSPKLAVVEYRRPDTGKSETRLYFLDNKGFINEICWTEDFNRRKPDEAGTEKWYIGGLTKQKFKAKKSSILTAAVEGSWLKVFYQRDDLEGVSVLWTTLEANTWAPKPIINF